MGTILAVGNICNAGDPKKGRADGFNYDALHGTFRSKTNNGDSMLKFICQKLAEEDKSFRLLRSSFKDCEQAQRTPIQMVKSQVDAVTSGLSSTIKLYERVRADDPDITLAPFGKKTEEFLEDIEAQVKETSETMDQVQEQYVKSCDFFMLDKSDERRKQSEKFFEFFNEVFLNVEKAFPKAPR